MTVGEAIRQIRKSKGLLLDDVAESVGTSKQAVSQWERGKRGVSADVLVQVEAALGIEPGGIMRMAASPGEREKAPPRVEVDSGWANAESPNVPAGYTKGHPALNQVARHVDYELLGPDGSVRMRVTIVVEAADTMRSWQNHPH